MTNRTGPARKLASALVSWMPCSGDILKAPEQLRGEAQAGRSEAFHQQPAPRCLQPELC